MNTPNIKEHNTNPAYLKHLLLQAKLSKPEAAELLGYTERSINLWLQAPDTKYRKPMPYTVQFALECYISAQAIEHAEYKRLSAIKRYS